MRCWVISPNVKKDRKSESFWKELICSEEIAAIGYKQDESTGRHFADEIAINDIILVAQGANNNKRLFLAGFVASDAQNRTNEWGNF